jgi:hypothetical protein
MKFDALTFQYLEESNIGSRGGHISIEEALQNLDTENTIQNFIQTSDPRFLIYPVMVASDKAHRDKMIKIENSYLSGIPFVKKVIDIFFTPSSPNYINIPRTKDGQILTQAQVLKFSTLAEKAVEKGDQEFINKYKDFTKTRYQYVAWGQLLTLVFKSEIFKESDRRQKSENEAIYVVYKNFQGVEREARLHVTPQGEITSDVLSSSVFYERTGKPMSCRDMTHGQFKNAIKQAGNTIDAFIEIVDGKIGRAKVQKTPSLIQQMRAAQMQQGNK